MRKDYQSQVISWSSPEGNICELVASRKGRHVSIMIASLLMGPRIILLSLLLDGSRREPLDSEMTRALPSSSYSYVDAGFSSTILP